MATVTTRTRKHAAASSHIHTYQPYPADTRYGYCACGATCRMSPDAGGNAAPVTSANPCVALYGRCSNPEAHCRTCVHLIRDHHHGKTYIKCELRKLTRGAGSDHRAKWEACGQYRDIAAHVYEQIEERRRAQSEATR